MELNKTYFYTATILHWYPLLKGHVFKQYIIDSLQYLCQREKLKVYAFVIMPNHLHIIWEMLALNGKEMPNASLMKFTGHKFLEHLRQHDPNTLPRFLVKDPHRRHQFWQRDPLPVELYSPHVYEQKLDYLPRQAGIHDNPLQEHWSLAECPEEYFYSSARFYTSGEDDFGFLTHYEDAI